MERPVFGVGVEARCIHDEVGFVVDDGFAEVDGVCYYGRLLSLRTMVVCEGSELTRVNILFRVAGETGQVLQKRRLSRPSSSEDDEYVRRRLALSARARLEV
jgi:hypothetical protein